MPGNTLDISQLEVMIRGEKDQYLGQWMELEIYLLEILLTNIFKCSDEEISKLNQYLKNIFFAADLSFVNQIAMQDLFYLSLKNWAELYFDRAYIINGEKEQGPDVMSSFVYVCKLLSAGPERAKRFLLKQIGSVDSIDVLLNDLKNIEFELDSANDGNIAYNIFKFFRKKALSL